MYIFLRLTPGITLELYRFILVLISFLIYFFVWLLQLKFPTCFYFIYRKKIFLYQLKYVFYYIQYYWYYVILAACAALLHKNICLQLKMFFGLLQTIFNMYLHKLIIIVEKIDMNLITSTNIIDFFHHQLLPLRWGIHTCARF